MISEISIAGAGIAGIVILALVLVVVIVNCSICSKNPGAQIIEDTPLTPAANTHGYVAGQNEVNVIGGGMEMTQTTFSGQIPSDNFGSADFPSVTDRVTSAFELGQE